MKKFKPNTQANRDLFVDLCIATHTLGIENPKPLAQEFLEHFGFTGEYYYPDSNEITLDAANVFFGLTGIFIYRLAAYVNDDKANLLVIATLIEQGIL